MRIKMAVVALTVSVLTSMTANAGMAEKKAMKKADAAVAEASAKTKAACGNASLATKFSWDKFTAMAAANEAKLKEKDHQASFLITHAGDRTTETLISLANICEKDADYKAEIAKLTSVVVEPKADFNDAHSEFALNGSVLTISSGHYYQRSADDFTKKLKAMY